MFDTGWACCYIIYCFGDLAFFCYLTCHSVTAFESIRERERESVGRWQALQDAFAHLASVPQVALGLQTSQSFPGVTPYTAQVPCSSPIHVGRIMTLYGHLHLRWQR